MAESRKAIPSQIIPLVTVLIKEVPRAAGANCTGPMVRIPLFKKMSPVELQSTIRTTRASVLTRRFPVGFIPWCLVLRQRPGAGLDGRDRNHRFLLRPALGPLQ